jgi:hypothetical protein
MCTCLTGHAGFKRTIASLHTHAMRHPRSPNLKPRIQLPSPSAAKAGSRAAPREPRSSHPPADRRLPARPPLHAGSGAGPNPATCGHLTLHRQPAEGFDRALQLSSDTSIAVTSANAPPTSGPAVSNCPLGPANTKPSWWHDLCSDASPRKPNSLHTSTTRTTKSHRATCAQPQWSKPPTESSTSATANNPREMLMSQPRPVPNVRPLNGAGTLSTKGLSQAAHILVNGEARLVRASTRSERRPPSPQP